MSRQFITNLNDFLAFAGIYLLVPVGLIVYLSMKRGKTNIPIKVRAGLKSILPLVLLFVFEVIYYLQCRLENGYSFRYFFNCYPLVWIVLAVMNKERNEK